MKSLLVTRTLSAALACATFAPSAFAVTEQEKTKMQEEWAKQDETERQKEIDGYLMPAFAVILKMSSPESGMRMGGRLDFGRLSKGVAIDFRLSNDDKYMDYGASLKFFSNFKLDSREAQNLSLGAGITLLASSGLKADNPKSAFSEVGVTPFVRYMFDTDWGFGIMLDLGMDYIFKRLIPHVTDTSTRMRPYLSVGIPIGI